MYGEDFEDILYDLQDDLFDAGYMPRDWDIIKGYDGSEDTVGHLIINHPGDQYEPTWIFFTSSEMREIENMVKRYSQLEFRNLLEDNLGNLDLYVAFKGYYD